jgi:serine/threonine protein kinase
MATAPHYTPSHNVGDTLENGKYRLDTLLGVGAFGEVWKAMHVQLSNVVAIKILHWRMTKADVRARFAQEARVSIDLGKHGNIVAGRDLIVEGDKIAIVMEYIDGGMTLRSFIDEWTPSTREALRIVAAILEGLAFAHESGVLHRDLKPENILLNPRTDPPTPMITDFGLAGTSHAEEGGDRMTEVGARFGTPGYLAFEQWTSATLATVRSDLYSVGVMLAELLGVTPIATSIGSIAESIDPDVRNAWLTNIKLERLRAIVDRATTIEFIDGRVRALRYPSARAMLAEIVALMEDYPPNDTRMTRRLRAQRTARSPAASPSPLPEQPANGRGPLYTEVGEDDGNVVNTAVPPSELFNDSELTPRKRSKGWIAGAIALVAIIGIGVATFRPNADHVSAKTIAEAPTEPPTPVTPEPIEVKAETPEARIVPVVEAKAEQKPEARIEAKAEITPKVEVKPKVVPEKPKVEAPKAEDPKPTPVTTPSVTIAKSVPSVKIGDTIAVEAAVVLPEGSAIASVTLRWRGEGGAWQPKPVNVVGGKTSGTITANATMGTKVEYYIDVRTTDAPGKANKSVVVTTAITQ